MQSKVLIICYYWPPAGGPGVQRWLKFVKYLPSFGVEPIVYVPENPNYPILDKSLENEVSDRLTILKKPIREPYRYAAMLSRKQTKSISSGLVPEETKQSVLQRFLLYVRGNLFVPDARVLWVKPSVKFLKSYIEKEGIQTIISTGPPHSLHLIGQKLKNHFGEDLKWIADFRDPWTTISYHDKLKMERRVQQLHKKMEGKVLNEADLLIVTSPSTKADFERLTTRPIHLITNGYDDEHQKNVQPSEIFTIAHIGSLLTDRNPEILWKVLAELKTERKLPENFKIQLVGKVSNAIITAIGSFGLSDHLDILGYVSHKEALLLQQQASILLLVEINSAKTKAIIPGKIFEYLSAQRPVIGIGPENADVREIITQTNAGSYVTYDEEERLKEVIIKCYQDFKENTLQIESNNLLQYHRKQLTERLIQLL